MGYRRGADLRSGLRERTRAIACFGVMALVSAQLAGCATTRDATTGVGATLTVLGGLALLGAVLPDCNPDEDIRCADDDRYYDEGSDETRAVVAASGGAAVLLGSGLVAASQYQPPKKKQPKRRAPPPKPAAKPAAPPPSSTHAQSMRELVEGRGLEVSVPPRPIRVPEVPRLQLPASDPVDEQDPPVAP